MILVLALAAAALTSSTSSAAVDWQKAALDARRAALLWSANAERCKAIRTEIYSDLLDCNKERQSIEKKLTDVAPPRTIERAPGWVGPVIAGAGVVGFVVGAVGAYALLHQRGPP